MLLIVKVQKSELTLNFSFRGEVANHLICVHIFDFLNIYSTPRFSARSFLHAHIHAHMAVTPQRQARGGRAEQRSVSFCVGDKPREEPALASNATNTPSGACKDMRASRARKPRIRGGWRDSFHDANGEWRPRTSVMNHQRNRHGRDRCGREGSGRTLQKQRS